MNRLRGLMRLTCAAALFLISTASAQTPPTVTGILNTADFGPHISPGVLASVFGTNFGSGPTSSVTVTVAGKPASVTIVSANQLGIQIPVDAAVGMASLVVTVAGVASAPFAISLDTYAPALFTSNGLGTGLGLILTPAGASITSSVPAKPGDSLVAFGVGLGTTNPQSPTGTPPPAQAPTTSPVTLSVGGVPATIAYAGVSPGFLGLYQINFTVPAGLQGTQPIIASVGGRASSPVSLPLFGVSSVVSNASFASAGIVSPGSIVSVFANGIGTTDQSIGFPATAFQGISVTFNGTPAPIFHLTGSQGQIDLLVPYELPTSGTVQVQVKTPTATTANFAVTMSAAAPGLYYLTDPATKGRTNVLAQFNNTAWLALPDATATALKIAGNCVAMNINPASLCAQPATAGDYLVLYATGLGKATPKGDPNGVQLKTGDKPPADGSVLYQTVATPVVTVGGIPAQVVFSGIAPGFPGLYQIDFQVPAGITGDDVPVAVTIGSSPADTRTLAIRTK